MYYFLLFLAGLFIIFSCYQFKEHFYGDFFNTWDYDYQLSPYKYSSNCKYQGTNITMNPNEQYCYSGYNIPYIIGVGTYRSEVQ